MCENPVIQKMQLIQETARRLAQMKVDLTVRQKAELGIRRIDGLTLKDKSILENHIRANLIYEKEQEND
jgi:hypothetical protein